MLEKNHNLINEVITSSSDAVASRLLAKLKAENRVRKLAPRIYTTNLTDLPENIVRRNLWLIIGRLWKNARLCHRTAIEYAPHDNHVFLGYKYTRRISLPGVVLHFIDDRVTLESDYPFLDGLRVSSLPRALLENLEPDKSQNGIVKCLGTSGVADILEREFLTGGEKAVNEIRDRARTISVATHKPKEFKKLDNIIGAILSTRPTAVLSSPSAIARLSGEPYDSSRIELFGILLSALNQTSFRSVPEINLTDTAFANLAFFESYFSNYIEGTEFELDEARRIIETGVAIPARNADSHDILGTYAVVSDRREMSRTPGTPDEFLDLLCERHRRMMAFRPEATPGHFKVRDNRAGESHFVRFDAVRGTLRRGFEMAVALRNPFARAIFLMFAVSEVHPFSDGNGRISRIVLNSVLTAAGEAKVLVPTVFRTDYIGALRKLTRNGDPTVLIDAMRRLQEFSTHLKAEDFDQLKFTLERSNAFCDDDSRILRF